jgi:hypothetical protein
VLHAHSKTTQQNSTLPATPSTPSNRVDDLNVQISSTSSLWIHPEVIFLPSDISVDAGVLVEATDNEEGTIVAVSSETNPSSNTGIPGRGEVSSESVDRMFTSSPMPVLPFVPGSSPRAPENNWNHSMLRISEGGRGRDRDRRE